MQTQKVFVSYSRADAAFATDLATRLKKEGANVWMDQLDIPPGARWDSEVSKAVENAECVLVILSKTSVSSNNVLDEVYYALDSNKSVVPVVIDNCVLPFRLRRLQYIDFSNDFEPAFDKLVKFLHAEPGGQERATQSPATSASPKKMTSEEHPSIKEVNQHKSKQIAADKPIASKTNQVRNIVIAALVIAIIVLAVTVFHLTDSFTKPVSVGQLKDTTTSATKTDTMLSAVKTTTGEHSVPAQNQHTASDTKTTGKDQTSVNKEANLQAAISGNDKPPAIISGSFVFHTADIARQRGDVIISVKQRDVNIWSMKVPAQSAWAAFTDFTFKQNIGIDIKPKMPVMMTMSYCSPKGLDIRWSGDVAFTLFISDGNNISYKTKFLMNTANGTGTPKCTEIPVDRVN